MVRYLKAVECDSSPTALPACAQSGKQTNMNTASSRTERRTRVRSKAKVNVQSSEIKFYDQTAGLALMEIHLTEYFSGEIEGESPVWALQVVREEKSASQVSMQQVRGRLAGRQGTLVLQGQENRRERQDHSDVGCRSRFGNPGSLRPARRGWL